MRRPLAALTGLVMGVAVLASCTSGGSSASQKPRGECPTAPVQVVVSVDQWGDIVNRLAGDCGDVTTIFKSTSADPHDYEPTPADNVKFTGAGVVVVNGLDYDQWAMKAIATLDTKPAVVDGGKVVGLRGGDNPHIWYGPTYVKEVSAAVTTALQRAEPKAARYFASQAAKWRTALAPYDAEVAAVRRLASGKTYGATEGIFDDMAKSVGLQDETPEGYRTATSNETDPAPGDVNEFEQSLATGKMAVLVDNTQTQGAIPEQIRERARSADVPVVDVTESVPPGTDSFVTWQVGQLRQLATALRR